MSYYLYTDTNAFTCKKKKEKREIIKFLNEIFVAFRTRVVVSWENSLMFRDLKDKTVSGKQTLPSHFQRLDTPGSRLAAGNKKASSKTDCHYLVRKAKLTTL